MESVKLYWWRKKPNFGDAINPYIVAYVSGREVEWAEPADCELVAIGSVMGMVEGAVNQKLGPPKYFWGTGAFGPAGCLQRMAASEHAKIASVRGPLTAAWTGDPDRPTGDAGLLSDRAFGPVKKRYEIGVVPHHTQWSKPEFIEQIKEKKRFHLIDVRAKDPVSVVREIAACEAIFSCSLHGLVIADAYHIPNYWMEGPSLGQRDLKFIDYGLSVGRALARPRSMDACLKEVDSQDFSEFWYFKNMDDIKDAIEDAFPCNVIVPSQPLDVTC